MDLSVIFSSLTIKSHSLCSDCGYDHLKKYQQVTSAVLLSRCGIAAQVLNVGSSAS